MKKPRQSFAGAFSFMPGYLRVFALSLFVPTTFAQNLRFFNPKS